MSDSYAAAIGSEFKWMIDTIKQMKIADDGVKIYHRFQQDKRFKGKLLLTIESLFYYDLITGQDRNKILAVLEFATEYGVIELDFEKHYENFCK